MTTKIQSQIASGKIFSQTIPPYPFTLAIKPLGFAKEDYEVEIHTIRDQEALINSITESSILGIDSLNENDEEDMEILDETLTHDEKPYWEDSGWKVELR
jgi:hypothetical protein